MAGAFIFVKIVSYNSHFTVSKLYVSREKIRRFTRRACTMYFITIEK